MKKLLLIIGLTILAITFLATKNKVEATNHGYIWQKTSETACTPNCGETEATHQVTYTCFDGEGRGHDECSIETVYDACQPGYHVWNFDSKKCEKDGYQFELKDRPSHKVPETKTVTEKCSIAEEQVIACQEKTKVCTDETATNFDSEVTEDEVVDNSVCTYRNPEPTVGFQMPGAPQPPACEKPTWAPTVTYLGSHKDKDGNSVFSYSWTTVKDGLHTYWISWGATHDNLPYSEIVNGESVDITMYGLNTNWIQVFGFDQGCKGPGSLVVN